MTTLLLYILVLSLGGSIISAFVVQFATTRVAKFKPRYLSAYIVSILSMFVGGILGSVGAILNLSHAPLGTPIFLLLLFIIGSAIYGWLLRHPTEGAIGLRKGMLISLTQILIVSTLGAGITLLRYITKYKI